MKRPSQERNRPSSAAPLQLSLLGGWRLELLGQAAPGLAYEKGRALLAYLAMERRWHPRDQLATLFWPESAGPRANLRQVLANLRTVLGDAQAPTPCLLVERDAVRFNPDCALALDVTAFTAEELHDSANTPDLPTRLEQLERAIALYQGEFLAGLTLPDCPEFEDWRQFQREALHRHALSLLTQLAEGHTQTGHPQRALAFARRHVALEPWDEPAQRRVMELYVATDQSLAALQHYEAFAQQLQAELGVQPEETTRGLYRSLRNQRPGESPTPAPFPTSVPASRSIPGALPERRQVTVLYCELTATASDPEDRAEQLREPQRDTMDRITRAGGHLVQVHGGGFLAYFGYPMAQENAAVLAVRTALAIAQDSGPAVRARLGVHTGMIVTSTDPHAPDTVGETSAQAIRLRLQCAPGEVAVSSSTHRLVQGYFHFDALDSASLRHASGLPTFRLRGPSQARARLEAAQQLAPFVGREAELAQLQDFLQSTLSGQNVRALMLHGEAGIGKSRLVWHWRQSLPPGAQRLLELRCSPEYGNTALHPFIARLHQVCDFATCDNDATRMQRLEHYLRSAHPQADNHAAHRLARLLGLPSQERYGLFAESPQQERAQLQQLLLSLLGGMAAQQPLVLLVEDLHWADPSTLELLERLLAAPTLGTVGVLLTARPGFQPAWTAQAQMLSLGPLSGADAYTLAQGVCPSRPLTQAVLQHILQHTDGVPLFVEEMAHMLVADADTPRDLATRIPSTLHDLLMARIDQLGDARRLTQFAATMGREFDRSLLLAVSDLPAQASEAALARLEASGLAHRMPDMAPPTYQFKHALVQEAAYQSQTRATRRQAHQRIAQALLAGAQAGTEAPELLARHFRSAEMPVEAVTWWLRAGTEAALRCATTEALDHFQQALNTLDTLDATPTRDDMELRVQMELGNVLLASRGYGSSEAAQAYTRAMVLGQKSGDTLAQFRSSWGLYLGSSSRTHHSDSMAMAEQLLQLADREGHAEWRIAARYACANSAYTLGHFAQACIHVQEARRHYTPALDSTLLALFGENVMASALFFEAWSLWALGQPGASQQAATEALTIASCTAHSHTLGFAYSCAGVLYRMLDNPAQVAACSEQLSMLAARHGFPFWQASAELLAGWVQAARGDLQGGARIAATIDAIRANIFSGAVMFFLEIQADAYVRLGQYTELMRVVDEGLQIMEDTHARHFEADLYRLKGECLLHLGGDVDAARMWIQRAQTCAQAQGAVLLERRAQASGSVLAEQVAA
jgi:predicted ATPase/DNA-binding SARP family transcriptional activator/class 3 adenylate cyclase